MPMTRFSTRRLLHRVDRVNDKVQNDLLQLNAVAQDRKRVRCNRAQELDVASDRQLRKKFDGFACEVVEVETFPFEWCLFQEAAHAPDDFGGAPVVVQDVADDFLEFGDIGAR